MSISLMSYRTDYGVKPVLVKEPGARRKYLPVLMMDGGQLTVHKVAIEQERYMRPLGELRPKHLKIFRSYGRRFGITSSAREFLRECDVNNQ